ncbi:MAG: HD domain-containing phosphohydrolase [Chloroflexota bacterium]
MTVPTENILIVDDEETIRFVLNHKLSKHGYRCDEAGDASQAMDKLQRQRSELVLLDINMPGKPGNELLPEIRASFPETAVIMASGVADAGIITRCILDGAQDYLHKPFQLNDVLLSVTMTLEKRRLEMQLREHQPSALKNGNKKIQKLRKLFLQAVEDLVNNLEANDKYTAGHSRRVCQTALAIGQELDLAPADLEDLRWGSLLHDVGKIAIDNRILNKPDKLSPDEYRYIMTHAVVGPNLVRPLVNDNVAAIILYHHDHYDGKGLDQTHSGDEIPLGARIVAAADAFDAMTSDRPYRHAMPREAALEEMRRFSGSQFDPTVAGIIDRVFRISTAQTILG